MGVGLLLFAAWVGHAYLLTTVLNLLYARHLSRKRLAWVKLAIALAVVPAPPALAAWQWSRPGGLAAAWEPGPTGLLFGYLCVCAFLGAVWFPLVSVLLRLRPTPPAVAEARSVVFDVAAHLGEKPAGDGPQRRVALLPFTDTFRVEFSHFVWELPDLPAALDGLTVLHLSDLHFLGVPGRRFFEAVVERAMADGVPDVVAVTGDFVDTDRHHRWVLPVLGRLRWAAAGFAVLGNHDYYHEPDRLRRRLAKAGLTVLSGRWQVVELRGEPVGFIGQEAPWFPAPDLKGCPDVFRVCLSHSPDQARWAADNGASLVLAGHNHGGQVRLPVVGPLFVPSRHGRRYAGGTFQVGRALLHVNRGLSGKDALRVNCKPQVTRAVLRRGL